MAEPSNKLSRAQALIAESRDPEVNWHGFRALQAHPLMHATYLGLPRRVKASDNLITRFARRSARPQWVLPEEPLGIVDNYGVV